MGTCETGVLRCFYARHEASMWSEWLCTYECRRRHAADTPIGPLKKEIPRPGNTGTRDAAAGAAGGVWCPGMRGRVWSGAIFFH